MKTFQELGISESVCKAVAEIGYEEPSPIQAKAIPMILAGHDVLGKSQTGTGKTAAFGIPAIEHIKRKEKYPQVLILCPTRELVLQVATELRRFCKYKEGVKIAPIYGGEPIQRQIQLLSRGAGIVVGTPGRVMDHMRRHTLKLEHCDMVVLDEADEMLNMGFKEDMEEILKSFPHAHQTILFSATMPKAILDITKQFQSDAKHVEIASKQKTITTVEQLYYDVPRGKKSDALVILLQHFSPRLTMVFCNTKKQVDELCEELSKHQLDALGLHGDMKQELRTRVMNQYRSGAYPILVATDVAARGIDVDDIEMVINYDLPQDQEYYIHRIGRTGRAGKSGKAISFVSGKRQEQEIKRLMHLTKTNIRYCTLPSAIQLLESSKKRFIEEVKQECSEGITADSMDIANRIMAEGISIENMISALITMNFKPNIIEFETKGNKKHMRDYETATLRFSLGKKDRIQAGHLVCAIVETCDLDSAAIGRIDVRSTFSLVSVAKELAEIIVMQMEGTKIANKRVHVSLDQFEKAKQIGKSGHRRGASRHAQIRKHKR